MLELLTREFSFKPQYISNLLKLTGEGNTVPFIARYRKEMTGAMNEIEIRAVLDRHEYLVNLEKRKQEVLGLIEERGKLTPALKDAVITAKTIALVEELYAPHKIKKKTKADIAREAGLEPLANYICSNSELSALDEFALGFVDGQVTDTSMAVNMARDIITENIGHDIDIKNRLKDLYIANAMLSSKKADSVNSRTSYENYYEFSEKISSAAPHRVMAMFRGEKEEILKLTIDIDEESLYNAVVSIMNQNEICTNAQTEKAATRALKTVLMPSIELSIRSELKANGESRAIEVFAENLKRLIMTPPVKGHVILGLDPAFRTGCKFAIVNETAALLDYGVIYPVEPHNDVTGARATLKNLISKHGVTAISIGNGTASRETEEFVANLIHDEGLQIEYTIVNEAGASVYSASEVAAKEFPELDVTIRGAISIARRVIDPMAELVKIEPKSIGVGMYQHDVNKRQLESSLKVVVEDVVNSVGVNLNTASASLLSYVSGLNNSLAAKIVNYREKQGKFNSREELLQISGIGESIYSQCAGFLKVYDGKEPLDRMFIHPERYAAVSQLLATFGISINEASKVRSLIKSGIKKLAEDIGIGEYTLNDIIDNLEKPDRDIRDNVEPVMFKKEIVNLESLKIGMFLDGKVTNVVDFGAFIDIGLKNDGLVHLSELSDNFVKSSKEIVKVGDKVKVRVLDIDKERGRVSLSMKTNNSGTIHPKNIRIDSKNVKPKRQENKFSSILGDKLFKR